MLFMQLIGQNVFVDLGVKEKNLGLGKLKFFSCSAATSIILLIQSTIMKPFALCCLLMLAALVSAQGTKFNYAKHGDDWVEQADDDSDWSQCGSKTLQSPIELSYQFKNTNDSYLFTKFTQAPAKISWFNTTVYIKATTNFGELYSKAVDSQLFSMLANEVRIRCHAEHKIAGQDYYDLELQIFFVSMYTSYKNTRVGLSLFFQVGDKADPVLDKIQSTFQKPGQTVAVNLDLSPLVNNIKQFNFWSYLGSATIPPCLSGKVYWIVSERPNPMSKEQRDFFYNMFNNDKMEGNWRNLQPLNDNAVSFYRF